MSRSGSTFHGIIILHLITYESVRLRSGWESISLSKNIEKRKNVEFRSRLFHVNMPKGGRMSSFAGRMSSFAGRMSSFAGRMSSSAGTPTILSHYVERWKNVEL